MSKNILKKANDLFQLFFQRYFWAASICSLTLASGLLGMGERVKCML